MSEEDDNFFEENDVVFIKEEPEMEIIDTDDIINENNDVLLETIKKSPSQREDNILSRIATKTIFPCNICGKQLSQKRSLTNHILAMHNKILPFKCQYCPKSFASQKALPAHERTHTGEKVNSVCHKKFIPLHHSSNIHSTAKQNLILFL